MKVSHLTITKTSAHGLQTETSTYYVQNPARIKDRRDGFELTDETGNLAVRIQLNDEQKTLLAHNLVDSIALAARPACAMTIWPIHDGSANHQCSRCETTTWLPAGSTLAYCPNCGAKAIDDEQ